MRFLFNERRAAQAAAYLIKLNGKPINYMVLIKLLYFADRESLIHVGRPITGDRMFSMKNGPVLSAILDLINMGRRDHASIWFEYISEPTGYDVDLVRKDPDRDELSEYELRVLEDVFAAYGKMWKWDLVELTHKLPEWQDPGWSRVLIDPEDILGSAGKSDEEVKRIRQDAEEMLALNELECSSL